LSGNKKVYIEGKFEDAKWVARRSKS
jgi:hypothetical protein